MARARPGGTGEARQTLPPSACILRHIVWVYGDRLGITAGQKDWRTSQLPASKDEVEAVTRLAARVGVEPRNLLKIWSGETTRPHKRTAEGLARVVRPFEPDIVGDHFRAASLEAFLQRPRAVDALQLVLPGYSHALDAMAKSLSGTYVTYRYPFEGRDEQIVCREVLRIWRSGAEIRFRMSYLPKDDGQAPPEEFFGVVARVDESLMFIGTCEARGEVRARARCLFVSDQSGRDRTAMFGILSSTRLFHGSPPCSACVVLVKTSTDITEEKAYARFVAHATRQQSIAEVLGADFAPADVPRVRIFIDNRPRGSLRDSNDRLDKELLALDADDGAGRDPVIRLHLDRFARVMPGIVKRALEDPNLESTFKGNGARNSGGQD